MLAALALSTLLGLMPLTGQDGTSGQTANKTQRSDRASKAHASLFIQPNTSASAPSSLERKSEATAVLLSLGAALVPIGAGALMGTQPQGEVENLISTSLVVAGAIFGPTAGYIYADEARSGRGGLKFRLIAGGISGLLGLVGYLAEDDEFVEGSGAVLPLTIGATLVAISAIKDIARADGAVRAHNARITQASISFIPTYSPAHRAVGLRLHMTF